MKQTMKQIEEQNRNQNSKLNPRLNQKLEAVNQVYEMIDDIYDSYAGSLVLPMQSFGFSMRYLNTMEIICKQTFAANGIIVCKRFIPPSKTWRKKVLLR